MRLLERDRQLAQLRAALAKARSGYGMVAFLGGEAGAGKTALAEKIAAGAVGIRVLRGNCESLSTPRPLGPLFDIGYQVGGRLLASLRSDAPREQLFRTALEELGTRASLVVIEDVHWADEASLDVVRFLGRRLAALPVLLLLTYREDEAAPDLRRLLGDFSTQSAAERIRLEPLSLNAVRELLGGKGDAAAVHAVTGGNPFFVTEPLAAATVGLPPRVRDAVLARADRLSVEGRSALDALSTVGLEIEVGLAAALTRTPEALDELTTRGLLLRRETNCRPEPPRKRRHSRRGTTRAPRGRRG